LISIFFRILI